MKGRLIDSNWKLEFPISQKWIYFFFLWEETWVPGENPRRHRENIQTPHRQKEERICLWNQIQGNIFIIWRKKKLNLCSSLGFERGKIQHKEIKKEIKNKCITPNVFGGLHDIWIQFWYIVSNLFFHFYIFFSLSDCIFSLSDFNAGCGVGAWCQQQECGLMSDSITVKAEDLPQPCCLQEL